MKFWSRVLVALVVQSCLCALVPAARAQGTGRSMDIDLSIRGAAMGGASNAVFWGDAGNAWGNPAFLGYQRGLRYEHGLTQLVPTLADDVRLESDVIRFGGGGVGISIAGRPFGLGGVLLDYGASELTDAGGNVIGTFSSYETVDSWGAGVSLVELVDGIRTLAGARGPRFSRWADLSIGVNRKHLDIKLVPTYGEGSTDATDLGGLLRITPFDRLASGEGPPLRVDIAYGYSRLNGNDDAKVVFPLGPERVSRHRRSGVAARFAANLPPFRESLAERSSRAEWLGGFSPLVSVGWASDHSEIDAGSGTSSYETDGWGVEVTIANVLSWRSGEYEDLVGGIDGSTSGWGVGLPVGPWAGVRYEHARFPQARDSGLGDLDREAWSAWLDPLAIWRSTHGRP